MTTDVAARWVRVSCRFTHIALAITLMHRLIVYVLFYANLIVYLSCNKFMIIFITMDNISHLVPSFIFFFSFLSQDQSQMPTNYFYN